MAATLGPTAATRASDEGPLYDENVKRHESRGPDRGRPADPLAPVSHVCVEGPFTTQVMHDAAVWERWVEQLGGPVVRLLWVRSDGPALRSRLRGQGARQGWGKLGRFRIPAGQSGWTRPPVASPHTTRSTTVRRASSAARLARLVRPGEDTGPGGSGPADR
ncbi:hypothetical protein GCM10017559_43130 [Streptosporangium longisporum]|uniref:Uncharacterized protein n=1 Tax=Streptosporangium longisporum TaxID=46187 RepID=A0ABP6KK83_9ACTN